MLMKTLASYTLIGAVTVGVAMIVPTCLAVEAAADVEEEIVVRGYRDDSPDIGRNTLAPKELPRSVQIISDELIEAVDPYALEDVLTLASNTAFLGDNDGRENSFVMRGFQGTPILRDGFRVETFGGINDPELFNVERLEVLKGPDSILYGESDPGGLVNMVVKRPLRAAHATLSFRSDSFGSFEPRVDIGGGGERVRFRLLGLYRNDDGWRHYETNNERIFLAPSVSLAFGEATEVTVIAEFTDDDYQADFGTAIDMDGKLIVSPRQVNNHPQDTIERHQRTFGLDIDHDVSGAWSVGGRFRVFDSGYDYSPLFLPFGLDLASMFYFRVPAQQQQNNDEIAGQVNVNGDFKLGGKRNRFFAGVDYRVSETENRTRFNPGAPSFLNWLDPDYSELPPAEAEIPIATGFYANEDIDRLGLYFQNHFSVTDALTFSLGMRHDAFDRDPKTGSSTTPQDDSATSVQAGVVYKINETVSAFASYSESFAPNFALDRYSEVLPPETGEGFELGLKGDLFDSLSLSLAAFEITKRNVATADLAALPTDPNPFGSTASGEQRSRGFEVDFSGRVTPNWQVFGSYGYTDSEITESNNGDEGLPAVGAPEHTASLWATYTLLDGRLRGLVLSIGVQHVGERLVMGDANFDGDTSDRVTLEGHTLVNASASYAWDRWRIALNLANVTDERYVDAAWGGLSRSVHGGAPFEVAGTVSYRIR